MNIKQEVLAPLDDWFSYNQKSSLKSTLHFISYHDVTLLWLHTTNHRLAAIRLAKVQTKGLRNTPFFTKIRA